MSVQIQIRRDTAANWTSANPTLAQGEIGYETDTGKMKVGDGSTVWTSLAYYAAALELSDLSDVGVSTPTNRNVLVADGDSWESRALQEADLPDLSGTYLPLQTIGVADDNLLEVDQVGGLGSTEYVRATANGLESRSEAEFKADYNLEIGTDVLAQQTIGIANDNLVEMDDADATDNDYAKFTANGLEGRSYSEVKTDLSLDNVENTQLSTWAGTSSITTVGTLSAGNADAVVSDANLTTKGKVEIATAGETTTGTDATRAVSPDGLAGSDYGKRMVGLVVAGDLVVGSGAIWWRAPAIMNGYNLVDVEACVGTAPTGAALSVMVRNATQTADMLSTAITIDATETDTSTAATAPVIDTSEDDLTTADRIEVDIDQVGSTVAGSDLYVELTFQKP